MIHRYDAATGRELLLHQSHAALCWRWRVSPDGRTLARLPGRTIPSGLWDPADSRLLQTLEGHTGHGEPRWPSAPTAGLASGKRRPHRHHPLGHDLPGRKWRTLAGHADAEVCGF